jgi:phospholipid/cholesterol/gamma-HCH transport system ATP-binding protein
MSNNHSSDPAFSIQVKNIYKSFRSGRDQVLKGVSMNFPNGKLTYILGGSGTGKSVTLKHILGLLSPDQGEIWVLGQRLSDLTPDQMTELRQQFGMVFQYAALFDDMTVFENVAFPLREHTQLSEAQIQEQVETILQTLGMKKPYDKYPNEISGGMRKRVGIARAIIRKPKVLLYDEPTTGLDPITRHTVDELIETVKTDFSLTSVVISHDIPSALRLADHIVFLHEGTVAFEGSTEELIRSQHPAIKKFLEADQLSYEVMKKCIG